MPDIERLQEKMKESGMTITAIAQKSGIERATLYNRLNGKSDWKINEVARISNVLGLSQTEIRQIFFS